MQNRIKAALIMKRANLLFFGCMLLALLAGAFIVTADGNALQLGLAIAFCALFLIAGGLIVLFHGRAAARYTALAKEEEAREREEQEEEAARNLEVFSEDGLPGAFCREIRTYSAPQLRLIVSEQEDEYTPEEFAFIKKVLAEEEGEEAPAEE